MFDVTNIKDPSFIKKLNTKELEQLSADIRAFLIENVNKTGGHLASNLGAVEATIAMHYVFDSPKDKILFDVGHQAYVHKILTGRAKDFATLRQTGGLSGYISRDESVHDIWESGHSSTTISAQAGFIASEKYTKDTGRVIAFIGDSSIANGVAFEGINFEGQYQDRRPIIILNDNKMGISKSVGALTKFLNRVRGTRFMRSTHAFLIRIFPTFITNFFHHVKRGIKGLIQQDNIFEDLGFDYYGPYEGNDIKVLIRILEKAKRSKSPCIVHIITRKGQGYAPAESHMSSYHGIEGELNRTTDDNLKSYSSLVTDELIKLRRTMPFAVICPAMFDAAKLKDFKIEYPEDCYDVGIAEEHATVMGAAMGLNGVRVFLPMYSTFSQRAFDYFLNDICRQNIPISILLDRAGVVGADGATHQGIYDISMLSLMPNIKITMGRNASETKGLIHYSVTQNCPFVIRYPRMRTLDLEMALITDESWPIINEGQKGIVISYGPDLERILKLINKHNLDIAVINARFIKPLDMAMLDKIGQSGLPVLVYEQVTKVGSLGMQIALYFTEHHYGPKKFKLMSFKENDIVCHGAIDEVLELYGLGDSNLEKELLALCD